MSDQDTTNTSGADGAAGNDTAPAQDSDTPSTAPTAVELRGDATEMARQGYDPSNTYENGVKGGVDNAVPDNGTIVTSYDDALERGYIGYAPGAGAEASMSVAAAGERNERLREARRATINAAQPDDDEGETTQRSKRSTRK